MTCGLYLHETASSFASSTISFSRRATSATSWPFLANTRASASPIPTEAPVTTVTGLKIDIALAPSRSAESSRLLGVAFAVFLLVRHLAAQRDAVARGNAEKIG